MRIHALVAATLFAASLAAQGGNPIGYPHDTVRAGSGNLVPFGFSSSTNFDEGRWQQLIPGKHLPTTPGILFGMAVNCQSSNAAVKYTSLKVTVSHTTATSLGTSFSGNLPTPQVVFQQANHTIQWSINNWVGITFTQPFVYDGVSNLVVDLQKVYDRVTNPVPGIVTHQTTGSPHRTDLVPTRYAFSAFGGGGSTTDTPLATTNSVLSMRLYFGTAATTTMASLSQPTGAEFRIGTNARLSVFGATGTVWATMLDVAYQPPLTIPGIAGRLLVNPGFVIANGTTSGGSSATILAIPNDVAFVATYWVMQSVTLDPPKTAITLTNALDFFVR